MMLITTILGLLIGVLVILYLLDLMDKTKVKNVVRNEPKTPESLQRAIRKTLKENQTKKNEERLRICPICGTILSQKDYLIAAFEPIKDIHTNTKRKVQIYGCPYCFTTDGINKNFTRIEPDQL